MKFQLKKNYLAQVVAIALCGTFITAAQAAPLRLAVLALPRPGLTMPVIFLHPARSV